MLCCLAFFNSCAKMPSQHQPDSVLIVPFVITTIKSHLALFAKKLANFIPSAELIEWESIAQKLSSKASGPVATRCIMGQSIYHSSGDLQ